MNQNKYSRIAGLLSEKYGLAISVREIQNDEKNLSIEICPQELHRNDGFGILINFGWRSLDSMLVVGQFAGPLVESFGNATTEMKSTFCMLAGILLADGASITMKINDYPVSATDHTVWPSAKWNKIEFSLSKSPLMYSRDEPLVIENLVSSWGGRLLGCVLSLSPLEEIPEDENLYNEGLPEGAKEKVVVNKYERNRFNRAACIEHHGYACKICSLDFEKTYGSLGAGYIHVHHIVPVSKMGGEYRVDPVKDLVPVCPNCHSMLHRKDPPYTVDEMILQIKNKITDSNKLK